MTKRVKGDVVVSCRERTVSTAARKVAEEKQKELGEKIPTNSRWERCRRRGG